MNWGSKRDANEPIVVRALERVGASVTRINETGAPDLLVGFRGATYLIEVKLPLGERGGDTDKKLKPTQLAWWSKWRGGVPMLVRSPEEALRAIGAL